MLGGAINACSTANRNDVEQGQQQQGQQQQQQQSQINATITNGKQLNEGFLQEECLYMMRVYPIA
jgi:hypothetical protein